MAGSARRLVSLLSSSALAVGLMAGLPAGIASANPGESSSGEGVQAANTEAPPPVRNVRAIAGDGRATVTWDAPEDTSNVWYYRIRGGGGFVNQQVLASDGNGGSIEITGLTNGVPVEFWVWSVSRYGRASEITYSNYVTPNPATTGRTPNAAFAAVPQNGPSTWNSFAQYDITASLAVSGGAIIAGANPGRTTNDAITIAGEEFGPEESFVGKMTIAGAWQWVLRLPTTTFGEDIRSGGVVDSIAFDRSGGYVLGVRGVSLTGIVLPGVATPSDASNAAVVRISSDGQIQSASFVRQWEFCSASGGPSLCGVSSIDVTSGSDGSIVALMNAYGNLVFGAQDFITGTGRDSSRRANVLANLTPEGQFLSARLITRTSTTSRPPSVETGSGSAGLKVYGSVNTSTTVFPGQSSENGNTRAVLFTVDAATAQTTYFTEIKALGSGDFDNVYVEQIDNQYRNRILVRGTFRGDGLSIGGTRYQANGFDTPFVASLTSTGAVRWVVVPDAINSGSYKLKFNDIDANSQGEVALAMELSAPSVPSGSSPPVYDVAGAQVSFSQGPAQVMLLDAAGNAAWQAPMPSGNIMRDPQIRTVAATSSGMVLVGGEFFRMGGDLTVAGTTYSVPGPGPFVLGLRDQRTEPSAPLDVVAEPAEQSIGVTVSPPADDGGSPITEYVAKAVDERTEEPVAQCLMQEDPDVDTDRLGCTIEGLTNDVSYTVFASARNAIGDGAQAAVRGVTPRNFYPGAPTEVLAVADDQRRINTSWFPPQDTGASAITNYTVTATPDDGSEVLTCTSSTPECLFTGLTNGVTYTIVVTATNADGYTGPASQPRAATPVSIPGPVRNAAAAAGNGVAIVRFAPPAEDGGEPILDYRVVPTSGEECVVAAPEGAQLVQCQIDGLTNGVAVSFDIFARNDLDYGPSVTVGPVTPRALPGQPSAVQVDSVGDRQATISWTAPPDNGVAIQSYTATAVPGGQTCQATAPATSCTITGLTNGSTYVANVYAFGGDGRGPTSFSSSLFSPRGAPGAPTGVELTPLDRSLGVVWTPPASDGGAEITGYVATTASGESCAAAAEETSCAIGGLTNGRTYTVTVRAANDAGEGTSSQGVSGVPAVPPVPPSAPQNVSLSRGEGVSIVASWDVPADDGGSAVTSYVGTLSPGGLECTVATTSCTFSNLTKGTSYSFSVYAVNPAGNGELGRARSPLTAATVPGSPAAPTATKGNAQATVSWSLPAAGDGGLPIIDYTVTADPGGRTCTVEAPSRSCTVSGLTNGEPYFFTVVARNLVGTSASSPQSLGVTPTDQTTSSPRFLRGCSQDRSVTLNWSPPNFQPVPATGYRATLQPGNHTCETAVDGYTCQIDGLTNGTEYTASVVALSINGDSAASSPITVTPLGLPGAPTVNSVSVGNKAITVSMAPPADDGGAEVQYLVAQVAAGLFCLAREITGWECTIDNLANDFTYSLKVYASNGTYGRSVVVGDYAPRAGVPSVPRSVSLSAPVGDAQVTAQWEAPESDGGAPVIGYEVTANPGGATCTTEGALTCSITDLQPDTVYTVTVRARNVEGLSGGALSNLVRTYAPPQSTEPSRPGQVSARASDGSAVISWSPPQTDGGAEIVRYIVTSDPEGLTCETGPATYTCRINDLTNGTEYTFSVRAENAIGLSPASNPSVGVTPAVVPPPPPPPPGPPAAPGKPTAIAGNRSAEVSWPAGDEAQADAVTGYRVDYSTDGGQTWTPVTANTGTALTSIRLTNLTNGTAYVVRVAAVSAGGLGAFSTTSDPFTPSADLPGAPARPVGDASSQSVALFWGAPDDLGSGDLEGYRVERSLDGQVWAVVSANTSTTDAGAVIGGLTNGVTYYFRVAAITSVGQGPYSATSGALTPAAPPAPPQPGPPPPPAPTPPPPPPPVPVPDEEILPSEPEPGVVPSGLTAPTVRVNGTSVTITWEPPTDEGSAPVTGYFVTADPGGQACQVTVDETSCVVEDLAPGSTYTFTVEAVNEAGFSQPSAASAEVTIQGGEIVIEGKRGNVRGKKGFIVTGVVTGLAPGTVLKPFFKFRGMPEYGMGVARIVVQEDGTIRWQRRGNKKAYVYVALEDRSVKSNRVIIKPATKN